MEGRYPLWPLSRSNMAAISRVIRAQVEGRSHPGPFRYRNYGQLAVLGRSAAVADFGWLRIDGIIAWVLWSAVHLFLLLGTRNKMVVYLNWVWAWLTYGSGARLMTGVDRTHAARTASPAVRLHS
jgi:NADH dehydrogenase